MADTAPSTIDDAMLRARTDAVCALALPTIVMDWLGSGLMAAYFWSPGTAAGLFAWLAATVVLCAARGGAAIGFQTGKLSHVPVRSTARSLTLFAGLSAILWSGA